jgi:hypothetical protein
MNPDESTDQPRSTPLAGPDTDPDDKRREMAGEPEAGDQVAFRRDEELDRMGELTSTEIYQGELEAGVNDDLPSEPDHDNIEDLAAIERRAGETADPNVAAEEGMTWVPPSDPPVVPDPEDPQGVQVAAGFGDSAISEPFDHDHPSETLADEDELSARVREALRADSMTSRYAETLAIGTRDRTVAIRGVVDDVDDSDNVVEVASRVSGVDEVVDELDVRALEDR